MVDRRSTCLERFGIVAGGVALLVIVACVGACAKPATQNEQAVIGNAIDADSNIVADADDRADHLDEQGEELIRAANGMSRAEGAPLRREGQIDLNEAATVRENGQQAGAYTSDKIERDAGLLNTR